MTSRPVEVLVNGEARTIFYGDRDHGASVCVQPASARDGVILSAYAGGVSTLLSVPLDAASELVAALLCSLATCEAHQDAGPDQARGHGTVELLRNTDEGNVLADALDEGRAA